LPIVSFDGNPGFVEGKMLIFIVPEIVEPEINKKQSILISMSLYAKSLFFSSLEFFAAAHIVIHSTEVA
jgi:hypothetical protein